MTGVPYTDFRTVVVLHRVRITPNADRCNSQSDSVSLSVCLSIRLSRSEVLSRWMKIRLCNLQCQVGQSF